jgi:hypothetical protein
LKILDLEDIDIAINSHAHSYANEVLKFTLGKFFGDSKIEVQTIPIMHQISLHVSTASVSKTILKEMQDKLEFISELPWRRNQ